MILQAVASSLGGSGRSSLQDENDELRERVRQLEALLGRGFSAPKCFGLTRREEEVLGLLMARDVVSREAFYTVLFGDRSEQLLGLFIHRVRTKIGRFDLKVKTLWGRGHYLTPETKSRVRALIEAEGK